MTDFSISREIGTGSWCEYLSRDHLKILWRTLAPESFKNPPLYSKKKANGNAFKSAEAGEFSHDLKIRSPIEDV